MKWFLAWWRRRLPTWWDNSFRGSTNWRKKNSLLPSRTSGAVKPVIRCIIGILGSKMRIDWVSSAMVWIIRLRFSLAFRFMRKRSRRKFRDFVYSPTDQPLRNLQAFQMRLQVQIFEVRTTPVWGTGVLWNGYGDERKLCRCGLQGISSWTLN